MDIVGRIKEIAEPIITNHDCYLDYIEYVKENGEWYLRIFIDKNTGNLDMNTCVVVNEEISGKLDEVDPIDNEYYLEVSSPGIEKPLKSLDDVGKSIGEYVRVVLLNPKQGLDEFEGYVKNVSDSMIDFEYLVKNIKKKITLDYKDIKSICLAVKF